MHQRTWMEFIKDCDFELKYHHGKANKVVDASRIKETHITELMMLEHDLLERL